MQDAGILSTGIQQWSAHSDPELPALLHRFKQLNPAEFLLYFSLYGLDVRRNGGFMLRRIRPDDAVVDLPVADRLAFFGGTRAGAPTTFQTHWAARFREASVASVDYRRAQILEATARFDRILAAVGQLTVNLRGAPVRMPLNRVVTSQLGAALILDSHINQPAHVARDLQQSANAAGRQPDEAALDLAMTRDYLNRRHTHNRAGRNAFILRAGLAATPGSFAGW
jgi:hypothetical protein